MPKYTMHTSLHAYTHKYMNTYIIYIPMRTYMSYI